MRRLVRWLRQPVKPKPETVDWDRFGRGVGRIIGGNLNMPPSDPESPAARAWERGGRRDLIDGDPTPRWSVLLGVLLGVMVMAPFFYLVAFR